MGFSIFLFIIIIIFIILIIIIVILSWQLGNGRVNIVCLEVPFGGRLYHIETSQFICIQDQLPGFCIMLVSAETNYRIDLN